MTSDLLGSLGAVIVGCALTLMGLYAYVGRGAPDFFRRTYRNSLGLFGKPVIAFMLPAGLGFVLLGSAFIIGKNSLTTNMLVAGLVLIGAAWLVFFIHPRWILPRWLRSPEALE